MSNEVEVPEEAAKQFAIQFWQLRTFPSEDLPDWYGLTDNERAEKIQNARAFIEAELNSLTAPLHSKIKELQAQLALTDEARSEAFEGEEEMHDRALIAEKHVKELEQKLEETKR